MAANSVTSKSGEVIKAHTMIWTGGVKANDLVVNHGQETSGGGQVYNSAKQYKTNFVKYDK